MNRLQQSFRKSARGVWRDMADAAQMGLFLNEETITERILLFLARRHKNDGLNIKVYTKQEEGHVGADWAWCFMHGNRAVAMRVQAKRLYSGARYNALKPTVGQINKLINQSGAHHPYYVFYNDGLQGKQCLQTCKTHHFRCRSFTGNDHWGCMIARAQDVKRVGSNEMIDLLPVSMPWHCMLCPHLAAAVLGPIPMVLPDVVAANLSAALAPSSGGHETPLLKPAEPPEWVEHVLAWYDRSVLITAEGGFVAADRVIEDYLDEHDLRGLALFSGQLE
jgi:hypothetical protein